MYANHPVYLHGQIIDEHTFLTGAELCRATALDDEQLMALVLEGVLEPIAESRAKQSDLSSWQFCGTSLHRACVAQRLTQDLEVNLAGVALALELMDQIQDLQACLRRSANR